MATFEIKMSAQGSDGVEGPIVSMESFLESESSGSG